MYMYSNCLPIRTSCLYTFIHDKKRRKRDQRRNPQVSVDYYYDIHYRYIPMSKNTLYKLSLFFMVFLFYVVEHLSIMFSIIVIKASMVDN